MPETTVPPSASSAAPSPPAAPAARQGGQLGRAAGQRLQHLAETGERRVQQQYVLPAGALLRAEHRAGAVQAGQRRGDVGGRDQLDAAQPGLRHRARRSPAARPRRRAGRTRPGPAARRPGRRGVRRPRRWWPSRPARRRPRRQPASTAALTSAPRPYEVVVFGSRSAGASRCRPQVWAHSRYAGLADRSRSAWAGRPSGSVAGTAVRTPPTAACDHVEEAGAAVGQRAQAQVVAGGRLRPAGGHGGGHLGGGERTGELVRTDQYPHGRRVSHVTPRRIGRASALCDHGERDRDLY